MNSWRQAANGLKYGGTTLHWRHWQVFGPPKNNAIKITHDPLKWKKHPTSTCIIHISTNCFSPFNPIFK